MYTRDYSRYIMISSKDVEHIAHLARIELGEEDAQKFEGELSEVLQFIDTLNTLDTSNVLPVCGGTLLFNQMREDGQLDINLENKQDKLMDAVPEKRSGCVKVRAIFQ